MGNAVNCVQPKSDVKAAKSLAAIGIFLAFAIQVRAKPVFTVFHFQSFSDGQDSSWEYTIPFLLKLQLKEVKGIAVSPDGSIEFAGDSLLQFAYREASKQAGTTNFFRTFGQAIEADYVLWGTYVKETNLWRLAVSAMNVHNSVIFGPVTASSPELSVAICDVRKRVLEKIGLGVQTQADERLITESFPALEQFSHAFNDLYFGKPVSDVEAKLRKALTIAPHFSLARLGLCHILILQRKFDEAIDECKGILLADPHYVNNLELAGAHLILGNLYTTQELLSAAEKEYLEAKRLAPEEAYVYLRLGQLFFISEKYDDALRVLQQAEKLAPFLSQTHEELSRNYIALDRTQEALDELKLAERYDAGTDGESMLTFGQLYEALHETERAVHCYELFLMRARRAGLPSASLKEVNQSLQELRPRLKVHFVEGKSPRFISTEELAKEIHQAASISKTRCSVNPFKVNPEMVKWAKQLVTGGTNDLEKARLIFNALSQRSTGGMGGPDPRTAEEAFAVLQKAGADLSCEDFTFLYVALARAVGVNAFYVLVNKDYRGTYVLHACAGILVQEKPILVDPAYFWFGVPHKAFAFQDDLQATGIFLSQSSDLEDQITATNLAPRCAFVYFNLATGLASHNQIEKARQACEVGVHLNGDRWSALFTQGIIEWKNANPELAIKLFRQSLSIKREYPRSHFYLGQALSDLHAIEGARDEFRLYLERQDDPKLAEQAREKISYLDGVIKESDNDSKTVKAGGAGP